MASAKGRRSLDACQARHNANTSTVRVVTEGSASYPETMSILAVVAAPAIGAHVVRASCVSAGSSLSSTTCRVVRHRSVGDAKLVKLDVTLDEARSALSTLMVDEDVTAVIHFSARKQVGESVERPAWYYQQNIGGMANVLLAMEDAGPDDLPRPRPQCTELLSRLWSPRIWSVTPSTPTARRSFRSANG